MVVHQSRFRLAARRSHKWGLPGGRIERNEDFVDALKRELREELYIDPGELTELGDYPYKGYQHRVYGAEHSQSILRFDRSEILKVGWRSLAEVEQLESRGQLHAGFEADAIRAFV